LFDLVQYWKDVPIAIQSTNCLAKNTLRAIFIQQFRLLWSVSSEIILFLFKFNTNMDILDFGPAAGFRNIVYRLTLTQCYTKIYFEIYNLWWIYRIPGRSGGWICMYCDLYMKRVIYIAMNFNHLCSMITSTCWPHVDRLLFIWNISNVGRAQDDCIIWSRMSQRKEKLATLDSTDNL